MAPWSKRYVAFCQHSGKKKRKKEKQTEKRKKKKKNYQMLNPMKFMIVYYIDIRFYKASKHFGVINKLYMHIYCFVVTESWNALIKIVKKISLGKKCEIL